MKLFEANLERMVSKDELLKATEFLLYSHKVKFYPVKGYSVCLSYRVQAQLAPDATLALFEIQLEAQPAYQ